MLLLELLIVQEVAFDLRDLVAALLGAHDEVGVFIKVGSVEQILGRIQLGDVPRLNRIVVITLFFIHDWFFLKLVFQNSFVA